MLVTGLAVFLGSRLALGRIESTANELMLRERALVSSARRAFAGLMASSVAHDANNVLTVVQGDLAILEEEPESASEALPRMKRLVHNLIALNRRLLQMVRQQATAELVPLELTRATRESIDLVRQHAAVRRVAVEITDGGPVMLRRTVSSWLRSSGTSSSTRPRRVVSAGPSGCTSGCREIRRSSRCTTRGGEFPRNGARPSSNRSRAPRPRATEWGCSR